MISVFTNRPVKRSLAMTGEITLRGNVLPIGGLKEKILAARRAGITSVIIPKLNQKELDEIAPHLRRGMAIHLVDEVEEVQARPHPAPGVPAGIAVPVRQDPASCRRPSRVV